MTTQTMGAQGAGASTTIPPEVKVKYVLYARKSSESEERQILSVDSQVKEMLQIAEREGLEIIDIRRESHSAKDSGQRPVFNEIVNDLKAARFNGIMTWAPDRLSRNAGDPMQYATHVLTEGTIEERRELLGCLKSKLILKKGEVVLGKE